MMHSVVLLTNLEVFRNVVKHLSQLFDIFCQLKLKLRTKWSKEIVKIYEKLRSVIKTPLQLKFSLFFDEIISLMRNSDQSLKGYHLSNMIIN